jgi:hypothetical protein
VNNELGGIGRKRQQTVQVLFQQCFRPIGENRIRISHASVRRFETLHQPVPTILRYKIRKVGEHNYFCQERGLVASWDVMLPLGSEQPSGHSVTHSKMNADCGSFMQHKDENCHPHKHWDEIILVILYPHRKSTGNIKIIKFLGSKVRRVLKADNLTAICGILNISQPYRPPRPVTGIALLYGDGVCFL